MDHRPQSMGTTTSQLLCQLAQRSISLWYLIGLCVTATASEDKGASLIGAHGVFDQM
jgi:hypothetical protein